MTDIDRRVLLKRAAAGTAVAGAAWVTPSVLGSMSAFAAGSQNVSATLDLWKYVNSQNTYVRATACSPGYLQADTNGSAGRGTATYTYTVSTGQICIDVTLSSGPSIGNRDVYLLLQDENGCVSQQNLGLWSSSGATAQEFSACGTYVAGATAMSITAEVSGGGGTAIYVTDPVPL